VSYGYGVPSRLFEITYTPQNHAPTAVANADVTNGYAPFAVNFTGAGSSDPESDSLTYTWDFGDGTNRHRARHQPHLHCEWNLPGQTDGK